MEEHGVTCHLRLFDNRDSEREFPRGAEGFKTDEQGKGIKPRLSRPQGEQIHRLTPTVKYIG
jgi:hypothetical protein